MIIHMVSLRETQGLLVYELSKKQCEKNKARGGADMLRKYGTDMLRKYGTDMLFLVVLLKYVKYVNDFQKTSSEEIGKNSKFRIKKTEKKSFLKKKILELFAKPQFPILKKYFFLLGNFFRKNNLCLEDFSRY